MRNDPLNERRTEDGVSSHSNGKLPRTDEQLASLVEALVGFLNKADEHSSGVPGDTTSS